MKLYMELYFLLKPVKMYPCWSLFKVKNTQQFNGIGFKLFTKTKERRKEKQFFFFKTN